MYDYKCGSCEGITGHIVRWDDRVDMPCDHCGQPAVRQMACPTVLRASYPDGNNRFAGIKSDIRRRREEKKEKQEKLITKYGVTRSSE